ncbi:hypothetical protein H6F44_01195 [Pseudanabaena sp. FACHB-1277]|uniref:Uncharacterized protein n=1 Tax=Pseudanabaena cinerea FACHB-1277 TaxID=2949581 RepID=A0A926UQ25_9CYAN|nr:hypothetical protein [Pseudanabaena cinerea]MBD2148748.1 hypothetical protein [Pseudanabaena cinerea FACHB-1277]
MFDLLISAAVTTNQVQIISQAKLTTVYLPVSTKQSNQSGCVAFTATNNTGRTVKDVNANLRDNKGVITKRFLVSSLGNGKSTTFLVCNSGFSSVEARQ